MKVLMINGGARAPTGANHRIDGDCRVLEQEGIAGSREQLSSAARLHRMPQVCPDRPSAVFDDDCSIPA